LKILGLSQFFGAVSGIYKITDWFEPIVFCSPKTGLPLLEVCFGFDEFGFFFQINIFLYLEKNFCNKLKNR